MATDAPKRNGCRPTKALGEDRFRRAVEQADKNRGAFNRNGREVERATNARNQNDH